MKVYISTNTTQPANCFEDRTAKANVNKLVASLATNKQTEIVPNVFLIQDTLENITIEDIDNCILLYHSSTKEGVKSAFKYKPENPGMHEQNDNGFYAPVFRVLINPNVLDYQKAIEIIKILGLTKDKIEEKDTLESKLNFLHHCLTPSGAKVASQAQDYPLIKDLVEGLKLEGSDKQILEHLAEQEDKDCFDEEKYLKHLRTLRDKLLVS